MQGNYRDSTLAPEVRAELLLLEMSLDEKIGQMCQYVGEPSASMAHNPDELAGYRLAMEEKAELIRSGRAGSFLKVPGAREANYLQEVAATSRLGIPLLIATDAIHGHGMDLEAATIFPSPIGLAASFDPALAERIAAATAREMRASGFHWTFSPNVDVARDPRWGRTGETFGEDSVLVGELGARMVRGYQGSDLSNHAVLACAKHLVSGGIPENGLNGAPAEVSERTLAEVFYPPFRKAVEAGVYTVMPAHNEVNGVPCHADRDLLSRRLRESWGFAGFVVSDWNDVARLHEVHRVAETRRQADYLAVHAGIDMHMHGGEFFDNVKSLVLEGRLPMARIDRAVRKILYAKFALGLFENRYSDETTLRATVLCPAHRELALEAARKSLVLLKNTEGLLPLDAPRSILVTGPNAANQSILGDWARGQPGANVVTVLDGIRQVAPPGVHVEFAATPGAGQLAREHLDEVLERASRAEVIVVVAGENSLRDDPERTSGENLDRATLELPGFQPDLIRELIQTRTPVVLVLVNGAPLASEWIFDHVGALIEAWEPGMLGGLAIAEVLFGHENPAGRLPITIPRSVGHLRSHSGQRPSAHHRGRFYGQSAEPLFAFGHGLSYTRFAYHELRCQDSFAVGEELLVELDVENVGARSGEETVLLYVQDLFASVTRPIQELKAFERVQLAPGERKSVRFYLSPEVFTLLDSKLEVRIEPGEFRIVIGPGYLEKRVLVR